MARSEREQFKSMICSTIRVLCEKALSYKTRFTVEALIGITVDDQDILLLSMNDLIEAESRETDTPLTVKTPEEAEPNKSVVTLATECHEYCRPSEGNQSVVIPVEDYGAVATDIPAEDYEAESPQSNESDQSLDTPDESDEDESPLPSEGYQTPTTVTPMEAYVAESPTVTLRQVEQTVSTETPIEVYEPASNISSQGDQTLATETPVDVFETVSIEDDQPLAMETPVEHYQPIATDSPLEHNEPETQADQQLPSEPLEVTVVEDTEEPVQSPRRSSRRKRKRTRHSTKNNDSGEEAKVPKSKVRAVSKVSKAGTAGKTTSTVEEVPTKQQSDDDQPEIEDPVSEEIESDGEEYVPGTSAQEEADEASVTSSVRYSNFMSALNAALAGDYCSDGEGKSSGDDDDIKEDDQEWLARQNPERKMKPPIVYKCPAEGCDYQSKVRTNINRHILGKHTDSVFQCSECDKQFKYHGSLKVHINVCHRGMDRHICDVCGQIFKRESCLREHSRHVHTDVLYVCECGKNFRWHKTYTRHKQTKCTLATGMQLAEVKEEVTYHEDNATSQIFQVEFAEVEETAATELSTTEVSVVETTTVVEPIT